MTNTKAITPTEPEPTAAPLPGRRRWAEALLPLALGSCLLVLALPRFVSAVVMLPVEPVLDALQEGRPVSDEDLARFASRSSIARQFSSSGRLATDLAAAKLAQAERLPTRAQTERRELVEEAAALLEEGLAASPANSFAWARLAYARVLKDGAGAGAADAWRMSVLTGPAEPRLALWRTRLGLALTPYFIEGDHDLLDRQIRFAWRADGKKLASFAKSAGPDTIRVIRAALLDQPEDLQQFETLIR
jgi:hypothetical protein